MEEEEKGSTRGASAAHEVEREGGYGLRSHRWMLRWNAQRSAFVSRSCHGNTDGGEKKREVGGGGEEEGPSATSLVAPLNLLFTSHAYIPYWGNAKRLGSSLSRRRREGGEDGGGGKKESPDRSMLLDDRNMTASCLIERSISPPTLRLYVETHSMERPNHRRKRRERGGKEKEEGDIVHAFA